MMLQSAFGLIVLAALAWGMSENRRALPMTGWLRIAATGIGVQIVLAVGNSV